MAVSSTKDDINDDDDNKSDSSQSSVSLSDEESNNVKLKDKKEKLFIEFMTYSDKYIKLRHEMHVNLARGHLNIARGSRSSLNKTPGKLRRNKNIFNKEMIAMSTIRENKSGDFELFESKTNDEIIDPITWFGSMVAKPISTAQTDFKNCVDLLIEMANIKQKLDELSLKWNKLK